MLRWLEQLSADSELPGPVALDESMVGAQQDDPGDGRLGLLADERGEREPVHVGHPGVEDDDGVGSSFLARATERVHGRRGVAHRERTHTPAGEPLLEDAPIREVVVDNEHAQPFEVLDGRAPRGEVRLVSTAGTAPWR